MSMKVRSYFHLHPRSDTSIYSCYPTNLNATSTSKSSQTSFGMLLAPLLLLIYNSLVYGAYPTQRIIQTYERYYLSPSTSPFIRLDGGIDFYFQTDGNLVVYNGNPSLSTVLWQSQTVRRETSLPSPYPNSCNFPEFFSPRRSVITNHMI